MADSLVAILVPETLAQRLERMAQLSGRSLEVVVEQALRSSLPPLPEDLSPSQRDALLALETVGDAELWSVERSTFPKGKSSQLADLRARSRAGTLTSAEQQQLSDLTTEADLVTLRKAYAAVLLRWRGH